MTFVTTFPVATVTLSSMQHQASASSSAASNNNNAPAHKYGQQPGGDTLTDFVTLVCQETTNANAVSIVANHC